MDKIKTAPKKYTHNVEEEQCTADQRDADNEAGEVDARQFTLHLRHNLLRLGDGALCKKK